MLLITLGTGLQSIHGISKNLLYRLEETVITYKKGDKVLVTGCRFQGLAKSQAKIMHEWLLGRGIHSDMEERPKGTLETVIFIKELLKKYQCNRFTIITSNYHIPRLSLILSDILPDAKIHFHSCNSFDVPTDEIIKISRILKKIPLPKAIVFSPIETVKRGYIDDNVNIHINDVKGFTALHWSSYLGYTDITQKILELDADVNIKSIGNNTTPLHYAIIQLKLNDVWELLCSGADTNIYAKDERWEGEKTAENLVDIIDPVCSVIVQLMMYRNDEKCVLIMRTAENYNTVLTERGIQDLTYMRNYIDTYRLLDNYTIISSPLIRALETTKIMIGKYEGVNVDSKITERFIGKHSVGENLSELKKIYPWNFTFNVEKWWWSYDNIEPIEKVSDRVLLFIDSISKIDRAIIISHYHIIRDIFGSVDVKNCQMLKIN